MLIVDYKSKSYLRFLNDMPQVNHHKTRFLITINGANEHELLTVAEDLEAATNNSIKHTTAIIDKMAQENISALFAEARGSRELLLFKSADLLFDKKTNVKNSHERDNGFDLNHLFKSIAKHNGIVLLATEDKQTLSASMSTKMDAVIRFK